MNANDENGSMQDAGDFASLGINPELIAALERLRIDAPTDIQRQMIPTVLAGRDVLARALTGAGKTNTYLLPILQKVEQGAGTQAVIVQPTRALALQFQRNMQRFAPEKALRAAVLIGGGEGREDGDPFRKNPDVLITIPHGGTVLAERADVDWSALKMVVIDEVDAILEERGPQALEELHGILPPAHQTIMLAGDLNDGVRALAEKLMHDPAEIDTVPMQTRASLAEHSFFAVTAEDKFDALLSFCKQEAPKLAIVLARDEETGREIAHRLERARVSSRWIDERHSRGRREHSRQNSRTASEVIVACDPAPRRLCTIPATHLLNYDLPVDVDTYMHRLDQTSRLRRDGAVISFIEPEQEALIADIEERLGKTLAKRTPLEVPERRRRSEHGQGDSRGRQSGNRRGRDEQRSRGRSSAPPSSSSQSSSETISKPVDNNAGSSRHNEPLKRDEELDARGIKPLPKTLGSRFRTNRRGKPLR